MFADVDLPGLGYRVTEVVPTELATHVLLTRCLDRANPHYAGGLTGMVQLVALM
jgi:hypothetical protein